MKKTVILILVVLFALGCCSAVFAEGKIGDLNAFETYLGKSKREVRLISPDMEDWGDGLYLVDTVKCDDGGEVELIVSMGDDNLVQSVFVIVEGCSEFNLQGDQERSLLFGLYILGVDPDSIEETEVDGDLYAYLYNDDICSACIDLMEDGSGVIFTGCSRF